MNWKLSNTGNQGQWRLSGALDINSAGELREQLIGLSNAADFELLDLSEVSDCDLASLQLLIALQKTTQASARPCAVVSPSGAILSVCSSLGIQHTIFTKPE